LSASAQTREAGPDIGSEPVIRINAVSKQYVGVRALDGVSFSIERGSVHALVGENGAGKSTLVNVLAGATAPSSGEIVIDDVPHTSLTPRSARNLGIRLVPQERHVCPELSVAENVMLGRMPKRGRDWLGVVNHAEARREARRRLEQVGLDVDPRTPMRNLSVVQTQVVEIARVLSAHARLVIMDEPTASLKASDIELLFTVIKSLRAHGVAFLYVSHHLNEIFELADRVSVLRDGRHVITRPTEGLEIDGLITLLLGRSPEQLNLAAPSAKGDVVLEAHDLRKRRALVGVSLQLHSGEILAVTGGPGSGRTELARSLAGAEQLEDGVVELTGVGRIKNPSHARRNGIGFLPEERKTEGILQTLDIVDNIDLGWLATSRGLLDLPRRRRREAARQVERLRVKTPHIFQPVRLLSGGNQQKVLLGRWLNVQPRVLVLDGPTEGVDIGSRLEIYGLLRNLANDGLAIVIFTSDLEEVELLADRAITLRRGQVAGELQRADISKERLLALEHGATREGVNG
jgi:ribose transport system ATP-binding protein